LNSMRNAKCSEARSPYGKNSDGDSIESGLHIVFGGYRQLQEYLKRVGAENNYLWKEHSLIYSESDGKQSYSKKPTSQAPGRN